MSSQSRLMSMVETVSQTAIGYGIAVLTQAIVFPLYDIHVSTAHQWQIGAIFTCVSLVRGFFMRRLFNFFGR